MVSGETPMFPLVSLVLFTPLISGQDLAIVFNLQRLAIAFSKEGISPLHFSHIVGGRRSSGVGSGISRSLLILEGKVSFNPGPLNKATALWSLLLSYTTCTLYWYPLQQENNNTVIEHVFL